MSALDLTQHFWEGHYREGTTRWDLGQPAPAFVNLLQGAAAPQPGKMAVLGAGRGHDALWFAANGFDVVGFDFAPSAIAAATATAHQRGLAAEFVQRDIFSLAQDYVNAFDYVLEHTCFCAIAPEQRPDYVQLVHTLLRPGGELIAIFWAHSRPGGPPFGTTLEEIQELFSQGFEIVMLEAIANSPENRQNEEYLARFQKLQIG